jgi:hypothetical protein
MPVRVRLSDGLARTLLSAGMRTSLEASMAHLSCCRVGMAVECLVQSGCALVFAVRRTGLAVGSQGASASYHRSAWRAIPIFAWR